MKTEYKYLFVFIIVLVGLVWMAEGLGPYTAISVIVGALCSSIAGFIGMYAATKANVRTATAAQKMALQLPLQYLFMVAQLWAYVLLLLV